MHREVSVMIDVGAQSLFDEVSEFYFHLGFSSLLFFLHFGGFQTFPILFCGPVGDITSLACLDLSQLFFEPLPWPADRYLLHACVHSSIQLVKLIPTVGAEDSFHPSFPACYHDCCINGWLTAGFPYMSTEADTLLGVGREGCISMLPVGVGIYTSPALNSVCLLLNSRKKENMSWLLDNSRLVKNWWDCMQPFWTTTLAYWVS